MKTEIRNRLTMLNGMVAAELPCPDPHWRRWVAIYPLRDGGGYRIKLFDLPEQKSDPDADWFDGDTRNLEFVRVETVEAVEAALAERDIDSALLDVPWRVKYPG